MFDVRPAWPLPAVKIIIVSLKHVEGAVHNLGANHSLILWPAAPGWHRHVGFGLPVDTQHKMVLQGDIFCGMDSV